MEELHVMPFGGLQFFETHWSERSTLLQGINGILPMFSTFLVCLAYNSVQGTSVEYYWMTVSWKFFKSYTLSRGNKYFCTCNFHNCFLTLVKLGVRDLNIMLLSTWGSFMKTGTWKTMLYFKGISKITFMGVLWHYMIFR